MTRKKTFWEFPEGLGVRTPVLPLQGAQVPSPIWEIRSACPAAWSKEKNSTGRFKQLLTWQVMECRNKGKTLKK